MSSEPQEDSDREQLSAADGAIVQNEEELCGQSRLMDTTWKPQLQLHVVVLPKQWAEEENLCNQQKNFNVKQEDPDPLQIKEEQDDPGPAQIKEEHEDLEPPQVEDEQEDFPKPEPPQIKKEQEEPEPSQIKEEQERICISQDEEQLDLKKETDTSMEIPAYEENEHSEADLNNQQRFNVSNSCDESQHGESTSTTDGETEPQNRDQMKVRVSGHIQNVDSSHMSESQCDSDVRKNPKRTSLGKNCKQSPKENKLSSVKFVEESMKYDSDEGPYVCEKCGKSFSWWSHFRIHLRTHSGEKPFSCKECDTSFSRLSSLKTHMRTHTGEKPYSCKECDTNFSKKSNLKAHMRTHTGEKPFSCNECDTSFSRISNLKRHMMTHTEEKPFSCEECDRSFSQISHLKTHMRTHTGEKPFSCKDCDTSFSALSCLKRHESSHR
ncbi:zinc finger protein 875 [Oryzias melastigma]|uniref:zinc finger protein 875 n=1 Tax=Oryzias melastigma TaxID=30732 RepID=UPI000CF7DD1D|nr:zinc finger protein 875 [Oryzias melastigma]